MKKYTIGIKNSEVYHGISKEEYINKEFLRMRAMVTASDYCLPYEIAVAIMTAANEVFAKKQETEFPDSCSH
jgi:hypothetical protein